MCEILVTVLVFIGGALFGVRAGITISERRAADESAELRVTRPGKAE